MSAAVLPTVIKVEGRPRETLIELEAHLASVAEIPGFLFGYIDMDLGRVVSFHRDVYVDEVPTSPLMKRVSCLGASQ